MTRGGLSVALGPALAFATRAVIQAQTPDAQSAAASDGPGGGASWTTGNKLAVGIAAGLNSKVWFTVAKGITTEVFYPRLDVSRRATGGRSAGFMLPR